MEHRFFSPDTQRRRQRDQFRCNRESRCFDRACCPRITLPRSENVWRGSDNSIPVRLASRLWYHSFIILGQDLATNACCSHLASTLRRLTPATGIFNSILRTVDACWRTRTWKTMQREGCYVIQMLFGDPFIGLHVSLIMNIQDSSATRATQQINPKEVKRADERPQTDFIISPAGILNMLIGGFFVRFVIISAQRAFSADSRSTSGSSTFRTLAKSITRWIHFLIVVCWYKIFYRWSAMVFNCIVSVHFVNARKAVFFVTWRPYKVWFKMKAEYQTKGPPYLPFWLLMLPGGDLNPQHRPRQPRGRLKIRQALYIPVDWNVHQ